MKKYSLIPQFFSKYVYDTIFKEIDLEDVESGKAEMISHDDMWSNINNHLKTMQK